MENVTKEIGSVEERLFTLTLKLEIGQYLPLTAPEEINFESFRTKIFKIFMLFPHREEIKIKAFPNTRTLHIIRKGAIKLGAIGELRKKEARKAGTRMYSRTEFTNSGEITDENVKSIAARKYMDEAGEEAQRVFESLLGLNWEQAVEQIGLTVTSIANVEGFFLYCLVQAPWKKAREKDLTLQDEESTRSGEPARSCSLIEQVLEMSEEEEEKEGQPEKKEETKDGK